MTRRRFHLMSLFRAENEGVALGVLELGEGAPRLFLRFLREFYAATLELFVGLVEVVAGEGAVEERADAALLSFRSEEHDEGFRARNLQLDPSLLAHGLVGVDL